MKSNFARPLLRTIQYVCAAFVGFALSYFLCVAAGSLIPANRDWKEPETGIPIYVETNGFHVSLLLPVVTPDNDWRDIVRPEHFRTPYADASYYAFGWGNKEFYRKVPRVEDVTVPIAARALFTAAPSAMQVDQIIAPRESAYTRKIIVTPEQYRTIIGIIRAKFAYGPDGAVQPLSGLSATESFYEANGRYHLFETCNVWTNRVLKDAGIKTGQWTPFQGGIMRWRADGSGQLPASSSAP